MSKEIRSDDTCHDLLETLEQSMKEHSSWRIGQLVASMAFLARQTANWDVENEEFVQASRLHLQKMAEHNQVQSKAKQELREMIAAHRKAAA